MAKTKKAAELVNNYITQKAIHFDDLENHKITRKEIMLKAGYSESVADKKNPENTQLYATINNEIMNKVGFVLSRYVESIKEDVESGVLEDMQPLAKIKALSMITSIFKGISPTYKQKSTLKDEEGNVKTVWTKIN